MLVLDVKRDTAGVRGGIRVDDSDTALEAIVEGTLSTATSKNLSLDHGVITACAH
jgi:hypothetical protein